MAPLGPSPCHKDWSPSACRRGCSVAARTAARAAAAYKRTHIRKRALTYAPSRRRQRASGSGCRVEGTPAGAPGAPLTNRPVVACLQDRGGCRRQRQRGWRSSQVQQSKRIGVRRACRGGGRPVEAKEIKQRLHLSPAWLLYHMQRAAAAWLAPIEQALPSAPLSSRAPARRGCSCLPLALQRNASVRPHAPETQPQLQSVCVRVSVRACAYTPRTNARTHAHARTHTHARMHTHTHTHVLSD